MGEAPTRRHAHLRGRQRRGEQPRTTPTRGDTNLLHNNTQSRDINRKRRQQWTSWEDIPVHGDDITSKEEEYVRFYFENIDGFSVNNLKPALNNNDKIQYFNTLIKRLEVDIVGGAEARTNWAMLPHSHQLHAILDQREGARTVTGHNIHEKFSSTTGWDLLIS